MLLEKFNHLTYQRTKDYVFLQVRLNHFIHVMFRVMRKFDIMGTDLNSHQICFYKIQIKIQLSSSTSEKYLLLYLVPQSLHCHLYLFLIH